MLLGILGDEQKLSENFNELMSIVGRMVRCIPSIRNLEIWVTYASAYPGIRAPPPGSCTKTVFSLESFKGFQGHNPQATLSVTHSSDEEDIAEAVPSEEFIDLWKESLSYSANASLGVQVISRRLGNAVRDKLGLVP